jgi:FkbM family methyltransferase
MIEWKEGAAWAEVLALPRSRGLDGCAHLPGIAPARFFSMKKFLRRWLEKGLGVWLVRKGMEPYGFSLSTDFQKLQHDPAAFRTILDVGANVGSFALSLREACPQAAIYCFEPVLETRKKLAERTAGRRIGIEPYALSDQNGTATMNLYLNSEVNSLEATPSLFSGDRRATISVPCITLEKWASDHEIDRIDLLKIDVEGSELRVLEGAKGLLQKNAITFVYLEVKAVIRHEFHSPGVSLHDVAGVLEPLGYRLMVLHTDFVNLDLFYTNFNALFMSVTVPETLKK